MVYTNLIVVFIVVISIIIGFIVSKILKSDKEKKIQNLFISTGVGLITSSFVTTSDKIIDIFNHIIGSSNLVSSNNYVSMICGFIFIVIGIYYKKNISDRFFVLNFFSKDRRVISDISITKDLKLSDFKLREQYIDVVRMFKDGRNITSSSNKYIVDEIKEKTTCFINQSKDFNRGFTGMGAVPYSILLGTYLSATEINEYFEYNSDTQKYYSLEGNKKLKRNTYFQKLNINMPLNNTQDTEVVVALSVSCTVEDSDLLQFNDKDIIKIGVPTPKDNKIRTKEQLNNYIEEIMTTLEGLKSKYINLDTIHLVGAIPSCLSVELGRRISLRRNRLLKIISYQYMSSNTPRYMWGLVITETNKGELIKV